VISARICGPALELGDYYTASREKTASLPVRKEEHNRIALGKILSNRCDQCDYWRAWSRRPLPGRL